MTAPNPTTEVPAGIEQKPSVPNAAPPGFAVHVYEREFSVAAAGDRVWAWLESPATFVDGQIWPFRVEFVSADPAQEPGFHVGGLNVHHGPLMSLAGQLTEIRAGEYRDLQYFYGSYVLSLRLIRPTRLEFWLEPEGESGTRVRLRVTSFVRQGIAGLWTRAQRLFWARFPRWMARSVGASSVEDRG